MEKYNDSCLRLAHSALDNLDPLLIEILDKNEVAVVVFEKQLDSINDYVEALKFDMESKLYKDFRNRIETFKFLLETLEEQGYSNLVIAKVMRALCRKVTNLNCPTKTNITEEQFYKMLGHIKAIDDEDKAMRNSLIGDLQTLGFSSGLYIPLTEDGFMILKEVVGGMLEARKYNKSVEHLNEITRRCNGLVKYEGIENLSEDTKEDLKYIIKTLQSLIESENNKLLDFFGLSFLNSEV